MDNPIGIAGIDPGFAKGQTGDGCHAMFCLFGEDEHGVKCLEAVEWIVVAEDLTNKREDRHFQTARKFMEECKKRDILPENAAYDCTGAGDVWGGVLAELWSPEIYGVQFGGAPSDMMAGLADRRPANEVYASRNAEIWSEARSFLRSSQLFGIRGELAQEMASRNFFEVKRGDFRLIEVEKKSDLRKRIGKSPNIADSFFICLDLCRRRHNFRSGVARVINEATQKKWKGFVQKGQEATASQLSVTHNPADAARMGKRLLYDPRRLPGLKKVSWGSMKIAR